MTTQERPWWGAWDLADAHRSSHAGTEEGDNPAAEMRVFTRGEVAAARHVIPASLRACLAGGEGWPSTVAPSASHSRTQHPTDVSVSSGVFTANAPELVQARKDPHTTLLDERVKEVVAEWPPLTPTQVDRLASLLQSGDRLPSLHPQTGAVLF